MIINTTYLEATTKIKVILIGGSSHVGKSTLASSLATKLNSDYLSTDSLAKHPGRPWISNNSIRQNIREKVVEHYRNLSVNELLSDVLIHYKKNVIPQVETIVSSWIEDRSQKSIVIEGSALYPRYITNLVSLDEVKAIWLTASEKLFQNRILAKSNFKNASPEEKYLIQKFLARTLLYDKQLKSEIKLLNFTCLDVESLSTKEKILQKCMELIYE